MSLSFSHQRRYDLSALATTLPELQPYIHKSITGEDTIDFNDAMAVKLLNKALLFHHYQVTYWDIPEGFLCPPIPSRADYIHQIAERFNLYTHTSAKGIHALDIGTGANLIYPIIGVHCYGWRFTATDINPVAIENAKFICQQNRHLKNKIKIKHQKTADAIFSGIISAHDWFDVTICNPPFYGSLEEAEASNQRKQSNLLKHKTKRSQATPSWHKLNTTKNNQRNFGGQTTELWCHGGERQFLSTMAKESALFAEQVGWFTTLVSKANNAHILKKQLSKLNIKSQQEITMTHGQKTTRIIAWSWCH